MSNLKSAGAVKYNYGQTGIPGNLQPVAVIELAAGDDPPDDAPVYDLTYYAEPSLIPASVVALAAHAYTIGQAIPNALRRIAAFVVALVPITLTDGKSLKFNTIDNSAHIVTAGM